MIHQVNSSVLRALRRITYRNCVSGNTRHCSIASPPTTLVDIAVGNVIHSLRHSASSCTSLSLLLQNKVDWSRIPIGVPWQALSWNDLIDELLFLRLFRHYFMGNNSPICCSDELVYNWKISCPKVSIVFYPEDAWRCLCPFETKCYPVQRV